MGSQTSGCRRVSCGGGIEQCRDRKVIQASSLGMVVV